MQRFDVTDIERDSITKGRLSTIFGSRIAPRRRMARVSVLFSLALLQGVSAAPTGGRTLEPEPVDDTERVNRETGRQVATDDYWRPRGLDTRWDTTEDTAAARIIMRAAVGGIAAYQHHAPCQNGMARPRITDVQRYGLSWLSSFGHTEYAIYARINGAASHVRLRVSIGNRGASPPPEARRRVSGSALLPADGPAFDDDAPLLTHVGRSMGCRRASSLRSRSTRRSATCNAPHRHAGASTGRPTTTRTYDPEFGEEQPEATFALPCRRAAVAAARSTKHGTGVKISAVLHMPPPRNESHKIAAGMQYHYDGKTPYAMGLLPSAGDVLVHSISRAPSPMSMAPFTTSHLRTRRCRPPRSPASARSQACLRRVHAFFAASSMMTLKYWAEAFRRGVSPTASSSPKRSQRKAWSPAGGCRATATAPPPTRAVGGRPTMAAAVARRSIVSWTISSITASRARLATRTHRTRRRASRAREPEASPSSTPSARHVHSRVLVVPRPRSGLRALPCRARPLCGCAADHVC